MHACWLVGAPGVSTELLVVLIPVHNDAVGVVRSLKSIRSAAHPVPTITVIVDDGSHPPLLASVPGGALDDCTVVRLATNAGIEAALNEGLLEARRRGATYVARLDAGDTMSPERLTKQYAVMCRSPEIGLVGSSAVFVNDADFPLFLFQVPPTDRLIRRRMRINSCVPHPTAMMRVSVLDVVGDYSARYPAAEDYELFMRMLSYCQAACVEEPLVVKVQSEHGISMTKRRTQLKSRLRVQLRYFAMSRWESYAGVAVTLALFLVPARLLGSAKKWIGVSRY